MNALAREIILARHESKHSGVDVANFVGDWLQTHEVLVELGKRRSRYKGEERRRYDEVAVIVRDYMVRRGQKQGPSSVSGAAISKWVYSQDGPAADKWLALSDYLCVPLWEIYDMWTHNLPPQSARALTVRLESVQQAYDEERKARQAVQDELTRAEMTLSEECASRQVAEAELSRVRTELAQAEAALSEARADLEVQSGRLQFMRTVLDGGGAGDDRAAAVR
jgi:hypothetical protein